MTIADETEAARALPRWCDAHSTTVAELQSPRRDRRTAALRQDCMWWLQATFGLSTPQIGRLVNRDHTTVLHGIERAQARATEPSRLDDDADDLARIPDVKMCGRCSQTKAASEFWRHRRSTGDGLQGWCKTCVVEDKRARAGTGRTRRAGKKFTQTSACLPEEVVKALRTTAAEFGELQSEIVERALRREIQRMWVTCRRCGRDRVSADGKLCIRCVSAEMSSKAVA